MAMARNNTLKAIQTSIFAPANYSIVASIAIHGLILGVILPRVDWNGNQNKNLQSTRVIELNEMEQTRLPDLSPNQGVTTNSLPQLPSLNPPVQIPPLPSFSNPSRQIPVASLSLPPSPTSPSSSSNRTSTISPSIYSSTTNSNSGISFGTYNSPLKIPTPSQLPAPPPSISFNSDSSSWDTPPSPDTIAQRQLEIAALSSQQELESEQRRIDVRADQYQEQLTRAEIISSSLPSLNEYDANPRNLINNRSRTSQAIPSDGSNLSNLPSPSLTTQGNGRNYINLPSPFGNTQGGNTSPSVSQNPVTSNQTQVAINSTNLTGENLNPLAEQLQLQSANTTNEEALKNDVAWREQVKVPNPSFLTIAGVYPKDACVGKLEGSATYGVVVNPDGGIKDFQLIKSSGYGIFNQQALKQIQTENIALSNDNAPAYLVNVDFKYNPQNCPSLNVANVGQVETSSSSNPQSATENTPKPEGNLTPPKIINTNSSEETEVVKTTEIKPSEGDRTNTNQTSKLNSSPVNNNSQSVEITVEDKTQPSPQVNPTVTNSQSSVIVMEDQEKTKPVTQEENQTPKVKPTVTNSQASTEEEKEKTKPVTEEENQTPKVKPNVTNSQASTEEEKEKTKPVTEKENQTPKVQPTVTNSQASTEEQKVETNQSSSPEVEQK
jgi:TonB family protein